MARKTLETMSKLAQAGKFDSAMRSSKRNDEVGSQEIDLNLIERDPEQPRKVFGDRALQELAANISQHGVLQPIVVQPVAENGKHVLIMGERRLRAAGIAGLKTIPAIVRDPSAELRAIQLSENVMRQELTTIEVARAIESMRGAGKKRDEIATLLGWSRAHVSALLAVVSMDAPLLKLAEASVAVRALIDLQKLCDAGQQEEVEAFLEHTPAEDITRSSVSQLKARLDRRAGEAPPQASEIESPAADEAPPQASEIESPAADEAPPQASEIESPAADEAPPQASEIESTAADEALAGSSGNERRSVVFVCDVDGKLGRIITSRPASSSRAVLVSFGNGETVEEIDLGRIRLSEVIEI